MIESNPDILRIIEEARSDGWVLEFNAKRLFSLAGFSSSRRPVATAGSLSSMPSGYSPWRDFPSPVLRLPGPRRRRSVSPMRSGIP